MLPATTTDQSDLSIAVAAARAAAAGGRGRARRSRCKPRSQGRQRRPRDRRRRAAEAAAVAILRATARTTRSSARRAPTDAGTGDRRWWIDGIDGTVAFAVAARRRLVQRRRARGRARAAGRRGLRPAAGELLRRRPRRGRDVNGEPSRDARRARSSEAHVASFLRQDRLVKPGVRDSRPPPARRGRPAPPRRPGLARARLGRRRPPRRLDPARHRPVGLAARRAAGAPRPAASRRVIERETRWHVAGLVSAG